MWEAAINFGNFGALFSAPPRLRGEPDVSPPRIAAFRGMRLFIRDPLIDIALQKVQRQCSRAEYDVMEFFEVELRAQFLARAGTELMNLQLAHFVRQGLAWPGDVAVDLVHDVELRFGSVVH